LYVSKAENASLDLVAIVLSNELILLKAPGLSGLSGVLRVLGGIVLLFKN